MTAPVITGTTVARGDSSGCRTVVVGVVSAEMIRWEVNAGTFCPLTAA